jgi:hypothetical protein
MGKSRTRPPRQQPIELAQPVQFPAGPKTVYLELLQNHRGRFVRMTEVFRDRRDTICIPEEMLDGVLHAVKVYRTDLSMSDQVATSATSAMATLAEVAEATRDAVPGEVGVTAMTAHLEQSGALKDIQEHAASPEPSAVVDEDLADVEFPTGVEAENDPAEVAEFEEMRRQ